MHCTSWCKCIVLVDVKCIVLVGVKCIVLVGVKCIVLAGVKCIVLVGVTTQLNKLVGIQLHAELPPGVGTYPTSGLSPAHHGGEDDRRLFVR